MHSATLQKDKWWGMVLKSECQILNCDIPCLNCFAAISNLMYMFTLHYFISRSCINEYLVRHNGGYLCKTVFLKQLQHSWMPPRDV